MESEMLCSEEVYAWKKNLPLQSWEAGYVKKLLECQDFASPG